VEMYKASACHAGLEAIIFYKQHPSEHSSQRRTHSITMKTSTLLASVALLFASAVTAQTACDSVASAVPTCGVSSLLASHRIFPFSHFKPSLALPNQPFSLLLLLLLAHSTNPEPSNPTQVPCISSAAVAVGCDADSYGCRCSSADAIQSSAIGCVLGACGLATALEVQASASAVCACVATAVPAANVAVPTVF
jgi:hypothetical protein